MTSNFLGVAKQETHMTHIINVSAAVTALANIDTFYLYKHHISALVQQWCLHFCLCAFFSLSLILCFLLWPTNCHMDFTSSEGIMIYSTNYSTAVTATL